MNNLEPDHEVFYFAGKKETDFIALEGKKIVSAFQVCWELNLSNQKRETEGLQESLEFFRLKEGWLLTYDQEDELQLGHRKIIVKPVWKWLLEKMVKKTQEFHLPP
jgi:predicted AAA+ superfamily ATPase